MGVESISLNTLKDEINDHYKADHLKIIYKRFLQPLMSPLVDRLKKYNIAQPMSKNKSMPKLYYINLLAIFCFDETLRLALIGTLPDHSLKLLEHISWKAYANHKTLDHISGEKIIPNQTSRYNSYNRNDYGLKQKFTEDYSLFILVNINHHGWGRLPEYEAFLPALMTQCLQQTLTQPKHYKLLSIDKPKSSYIYENNGRILKEVVIAKSLEEQDFFEITANGKPKKTTIRQLQKALGSEEFYEKCAPELNLLHTEILAQLILMKKSRWGNQQKPLPMVKALFKDIGQAKYFSILNQLLFHFLGRNHIGATRNINPVLMKLFSLLPSTHWVSIENIFDFVLIHRIDLHVVSESTAERYLKFNSDSKREYASHYELTTRDDYHQTVILPTIKGFLFICSVLGVVDIRYDLPKNKIIKKTNKDYLSVFDGLKYVRVTTLGDHILGREKKYIAPKDNTDEANVIVDENRLMITLQGQDPIKEIVLNKLATKVAGNRYKMDYETLLKDCRSKQEIEEKIGNFKQHLCANPPIIWEDFFKQVLDQVQPLTRKTQWELFLLSDDKNLVQLIAKDSVLQKLLLKAEGRHVAIDKKHVEKVRKRLASLGYLM